MKNTSLDKLRTLASAVADAEQGSKAWDKATDALSAKFSPRCLVTLIDQLEAAQRERDTLLASQEHEDNCLIDALASRDEWRLRAMTAEAELKRRDAQKAVAWILIDSPESALSVTANDYLAALWKKRGRIVKPLFLAAPAASPVISFYRAGVAAAANYIDQQREAFDNEHGQLDPDTGSFEFGSLAAQEHSDTLAELAEGIRSLHPHADPAAVLPTERDTVRIEHAAWSKATFGNVGPIGPLRHLRREVREVIAKPHDLIEWADMQFLMWDAQRRAGISDEQITQAMMEKLAVNKTRQWPEPKDGEPRLHIK